MRSAVAVTRKLIDDYSTLSIHPTITVELFYYANDSYIGQCNYTRNCTVALSCVLVKMLDNKARMRLYVVDPHFEKNEESNISDIGPDTCCQLCTRAQQLLRWATVWQQ